MQFRRTNRAISALMAMLLIASAIGARDASCLCTSCNTDSGCCTSVKSSCGAADSKPCGCCPDSANTTAANAVSDGAPVDSQSAVPAGCRCSISSSSTYVARIARTASIERSDSVALVPATPAIALNDGPSFQNIELANLQASSGPPLRILYCTWLE